MTTDQSERNNLDGIDLLVAVATGKVEASSRNRVISSLKLSSLELEYGEPLMGAEDADCVLRVLEDVSAQRLSAPAEARMAASIALIALYERGATLIGAR